jgi:hypothetical protein
MLLPFHTSIDMPGNQVLLRSIGQNGYVSFPIKTFKAVSAGICPVPSRLLRSLEVWSMQVLPLIMRIYLIG